MSIEVECLQCGTTHRVNDRLAGRRVRCPKCETAVHVPELDQPVGTEPPPRDASVVDEPLPTEPASLAEAIAMQSAAAKAAAVAGGTVNLAEPPQAISPGAGSSGAEEFDTQGLLGSATEEDEDDQPVLDRKKREDEELDMTPMVDVTFLLLIFFMVTAAFSLQKSIEMPRQQTDAPSTAVIEEEEDELDLVEVQVDEYGGFLVLATDWERETPGKQNLITALKEAIAGAPDGMRLIIKVHELAKLRALVDAMDAGTIAGYKELEVTQVEEFD